jgi:excisionase family DNA binding protein
MAAKLEELWTVGDLSTHSKLAKSTIYEWVREGYIPHLRVGGAIRFRPSEVQAWLERHAKPGRLHRIPDLHP